MLVYVYVVLGFEIVSEVLCQQESGTNNIGGSAVVEPVPETTTPDNGPVYTHQVGLAAMPGEPMTRSQVLLEHIRQNKSNISQTVANSSKKSSKKTFLQRHKVKAMVVGGVLALALAVFAFSSRARSFITGSSPDSSSLSGVNDTRPPLKLFEEVGENLASKEESKVTLDNWQKVNSHGLSSVSVGNAHTIIKNGELQILNVENILKPLVKDVVVTLPTHKIPGGVRLTKNNFKDNHTIATLLCYGYDNVPNVGEKMMASAKAEMFASDACAAVADQGAMSGRALGHFMEANELWKVMLEAKGRDPLVGRGNEKVGTMIRVSEGRILQDANGNQVGGPTIKDWARLSLQPWFNDQWKMLTDISKQSAVSYDIDVLRHARHLIIGLDGIDNHIPELGTNQAIKFNKTELKKHASIILSKQGVFLKQAVSEIEKVADTLDYNKLAEFSKVLACMAEMDEFAQSKPLGIAPTGDQLFAANWYKEHGGDKFRKLGQAVITMQHIGQYQTYIQAWNEFNTPKTEQYKNLPSYLKQTMESLLKDLVDTHKMTNLQCFQDSLKTVNYA